MKRTNAIDTTGGGLKTLFIDIMLGDRYVCTLRYRYSPLFPIPEEDLHNFVIEKRPSLKGKPFLIRW